jgi:hypothetical protein
MLTREASRKPESLALIVARAYDPTYKRGGKGCRRRRISKYSKGISVKWGTTGIRMPHVAFLKPVIVDDPAG